ncbi:MAG TPA: hypothetical protein VKS60_15530, partial [Stellaceae bacterium]|nr:hypothetical protein [Stellaceae bacterium]
MTVAALAALAGSPASAQTSSSGPLVYVGRVIVQSAVVEGTTTACSGGSDTPATGDTYSGVLRLPGNPANWKLEILNSAFAARVVRVAPHHVSATIFNSN